MDLIQGSKELLKNVRWVAGVNFMHNILQNFENYLQNFNNVYSKFSETSTSNKNLVLL